MEYKERMLRELTGLIERRVKLENYLKNTSGLTSANENESKERELKMKQEEVMCQYEEILIQRILLEMN